jgi:hypothetical protein
VTVLTGIRGSSVKSLFAHFNDIGTGTAGSYNGKYDGKNLNLQACNWSISGVRYPQNIVNPMTQPATIYRNLKMAIGSFNSSQFNTAIVPARYCVYSATGSALTAPNIDANYSTASAAGQLCSFLYGENLEIVAKRGLLSGTDCRSAPVMFE